MSGARAIYSSFADRYSKQLVGFPIADISLIELAKSVVYKQGWISQISVQYITSMHLYVLTGLWLVLV